MNDRQADTAAWGRLYELAARAGLTKRAVNAYVQTTPHYMAATTTPATLRKLRERIQSLTNTLQSGLDQGTLPQDFELTAVRLLMRHPTMFQSMTDD